MQSPPEINHYEFPPELYVPRGTIALSPKAVDVARQFVIDLGKFDSTAKWIAGFQWCLARTMQWAKDSETFDEGPGIDLGGFRFSEIETGTVETVDGTPIVFLIPPDIVAAAKNKTIVQLRLNSGRASFALE